MTAAGRRRGEGREWEGLAGSDRARWKRLADAVVFVPSDGVDGGDNDVEMRFVVG